MIGLLVLILVLGNLDFGFCVLELLFKAFDFVVETPEIGSQRLMQEMTQLSKLCSKEYISRNTTHKLLLVQKVLIERGGLALSKVPHSKVLIGRVTEIELVQSLVGSKSYL